MSASRVPRSKTANSSRRGSASRASTSSLSDSEDAITPCPVETPTQPQQKCEDVQPTQPPAHRRRSWRNSQVYLDPLDGDSHDSGVDPESLWRRMLTVQKLFGCYKSARMMAALEMGADHTEAPSQTCLDLLNDSLNHLPEDEKKQVEEYLEHDNAARRSSTWTRRGIHA